MILHHLLFIIKIRMLIIRQIHRIVLMLQTEAVIQEKEITQLVRMVKVIVTTLSMMIQQLLPKEISLITVLFPSYHISHQKQLT